MVGKERGRHPVSWMRLYGGGTLVKTKIGWDHSKRLGMLFGNVLYRSVYFFFACVYVCVRGKTRKFFAHWAVFVMLVCNNKLHVKNIWLVPSFFFVMNPWNGAYCKNKKKSVPFHSVKKDDRRSWAKSKECIKQNTFVCNLRLSILPVYQVSWNIGLTGI